MTEIPAPQPSPGDPPDDSPQGGTAGQTPVGEGPLGDQGAARGGPEQAGRSDEGADQVTPGGSGAMARGPSEEQEKERTCRIMFIGKGYKHWNDDVRKLIKELNPERTLADIERRVTEKRYHISEQLMSDDRVIVMAEGQGDLTKEKGRAKWLTWWAGQLDKPCCRCSITLWLPASSSTLLCAGAAG